jgi:uncharacterized membrane protein
VGLPAIFWAVLLIGGVILVGFTYLFGLRSTLVHTLVVATFPLTIAMVLFIVGSREYPLRGRRYGSVGRFLFGLGQVPKKHP